MINYRTERGVLLNVERGNQAKLAGKTITNVTETERDGWFSSLSDWGQSKWQQIFQQNNEMNFKDAAAYPASCHQ